MMRPAATSRQASTEAKPRLVDRLAAFLQKYRIVLLVLLIALVVFVVVYFSWSEWQKRSREKSTLMAERAQKLYEQWLEADPEDKRESLQQDLNQLIDQIKKRYPRQYAAQRAGFIRASMAFENEQWPEAAQGYKSVADSFSKSYLAPLSLFNAGIAFEQDEDVDKGITAFQELVDNHADSFLVPHALFSLGRLYETQEDFENAFKVYDKLEDEYPLSNWTKMGRNRIIDLKIKGKIAE